jgi:hypothetical protein
MTIKAIPLFGGTFFKNSSMASNPPAEAPMQMMGKEAGKMLFTLFWFVETALAEDMAAWFFELLSAFGERFIWSTFVKEMSLRGPASMCMIGSWVIMEI